ncbi:MAG: PqqD family protein [Clostridia bacterium]|nr:PqqD family protein [Clostridia bacterium]
MQLKPNFIVRKIANDTVLMDTNDTSKLLRLNETAADILSLLTEGLSEDAAAEKLVEQYEIDLATAKADVARIVENLIALGAVEA